MDVRRWLTLVACAWALAACDNPGGRIDIYDPDANAGDSGGSDTGGGVATSGVLTTGDPSGPQDSGSPPEADDGPGDGDDGPGMQTSGPNDGGAPNVCGDNMRGGDEVCDGSDHGAENCKSQGFDGGELGCAADCSAFDDSGCLNYECGDDVAQGEEVCDGTDLLGEDCLSLGYDGGPLGCKADCSAFEPHLCITAECGDGVVEGLEICDGAELDGQDCESLGYNGGTLTCSDTCTAFDAGACECGESDVATTGVVVASGNTEAEDDTLTISCAMGGGNDHIVSFTAPEAGEYVFETVDSEFDTALAAFDSCDFTSELACNDDAAGQQSQITLTLESGQTVLLAIDGWNGETGDWVLNINAGDDACVEATFDAEGSPAGAGTTVQQDEDIGQSCGNGGAVDHLVRFIAPATGTFTIDTFGSGYDTVLAAYTSCDPDSELVCNDDAAGGQQSQISLGMMEGQDVLIAVSGFAGATGNWELNIAQD
ncbi:MAG: hypothetical protein AAF721_18390 [Myxococcota bacterium]